MYDAYGILVSRKMNIQNSLELQNNIYAGKMWKRKICIYQYQSSVFFSLSFAQADDDDVDGICNTSIYQPRV